LPSRVAWTQLSFETWLDCYREQVNAPFLRHISFPDFFFLFRLRFFRSQQDIDSQKEIKDAQSAEIEFFKNHPVYRGVTDRCGSAVLARRCNKVLLLSICPFLSLFPSFVIALTFLSYFRSILKNPYPNSDNKSANSFKLEPPNWRCTANLSTPRGLTYVFLKYFPTISWNLRKFLRLNLSAPLLPLAYDVSGLAPAPTSREIR
jgi:hypothetical protein